MIMLLIVFFATGKPSFALAKKREVPHLEPAFQASSPKLSRAAPATERPLFLPFFKAIPHASALQAGNPYCPIPGTVKAIAANFGTKTACPARHDWAPAMRRHTARSVKFRSQCSPPARKLDTCPTCLLCRMSRRSILFSGSGIGTTADPQETGRKTSLKK